MTQTIQTTQVSTAQRKTLSITVFILLGKALSQMAAQFRGQVQLFPLPEKWLFLATAYSQILTTLTVLKLRLFEAVSNTK